MKNKRINVIVVLIITALIASVICVFRSISQNKVELSAETRRAMNYEELTENDAIVDGTDNVKFSAFFTRDLDGDGYVERLKGTCKEVQTTDLLYMDFNVLGEGKLKNGKITINANNFKWKTAIVADSIVAQNYNGNVNEIELNSEISGGSQKVFWGSISADIKNNINNYTAINSVTLTGIYVDDDNNEIEINKTIDLTVDWYGETKTAVNKYKAIQNNDIAGLIKDEKVQVKFNAVITETLERLILQKQVVEIDIPEFNGYKASNAYATSSRVNYEYNEEKGKLYVTNESKVQPNGAMQTILARNNEYEIVLEYPIEAWQAQTENTVSIDIPIKGYNYGYNNPNPEFENPYVSEDSNIVTVIYEQKSEEPVTPGSGTTTTKTIWGLNTSIGDYVYSSTIGSRNRIAKDTIIERYNGNIYENAEDKYTVSWNLTIYDYTNMSKITLEEPKENEIPKTDKFLNSSSVYTGMKQYETTTEVKFDNAYKILGKDGWIKLYDAENETLQETFTYENWNNAYKTNLKSIKIETSAPIANGALKVLQTKEIDDELVTDDFTKEQFQAIRYIYTYLKGTIDAKIDTTLANEKNQVSTTTSNYAYYEEAVSIQSISVEPKTISNQKTENAKIKIETKSSNEFEKKWINGILLVEFPADIINVELNSVTSNNSAKVQSYSAYRENGINFIKIYMNNSFESLYDITIDVDLSANPLTPTLNQTVALYAYNENCNNYYSSKQDKYDANGNLSNIDYVGYATTTITTAAPSELLTTEYITDYDDFDSTTIAPNIAEIEKQTGARTATVNVSLTNNYVGTVSEVNILGRIPFEGNKYILTEKNLKSKYTATLTGPINIPEEFRNIVTIYYSTNGEASKDLTDENNGWTTEVQNWNEIKSYLIDFGDYVFKQKGNNVFTYEVSVPGGVGYDSATFSNHAIYYCLDTQEGKLRLQTEPNRVGIQVVGKYSMQLVKSKLGNENTKVKGATYRVITKDLNDKEISSIAITDENGILTFNNIYIGREYILEELQSPTDYVLNENKIKFTTSVDNEGNLNVQVIKDEEINGDFKETPTVELDSNENYIVKAKVEDEAKYTITINKTGEDNQVLQGTQFLFGDEENTKTYVTDSTGKIVLRNLEVGKEYKIKETKSRGYYVDTDFKTFKILRVEEDGEKILKIQTEDETLKNAVITSPDGVAQTQIVFNIQNEKIPTYKLQVLKVNETKEGEEEIPLANAYFRLASEDLIEQEEYKTDENGLLEIDGLYQHVDGKYITGNYVLQETKAPAGYTNDGEEIYFSVTKKDDDILEVNIEDRDNFGTLKDATIEGNILKIIIQDKPLFKLTKLDSETGLPLANTEFIIYRIDENGMDFAKDPYGYYLGELNSEGDYVVTTNEQGEIILPLPNGNYVAIEVTYPEGYQENGEVEYFKVDNGNKVQEDNNSGNNEPSNTGDNGDDNQEENNDNEKEIVEINYIEDLVDLSKAVNEGDTFENKIVKLNRTLDFTNDEHYKNAESTEYGDLNGNNEVETIKEELTNTEGTGFTPIGDNSNQFKGIFDGQGYEIRNIYINGNIQYAGLFGYISNAEIRNLGIAGEVSSSSDSIFRNSYAGGIAGYASGSTISNSYNIGTVSSSSSYYNYAGGIAGYASGSTISNSYNTGIVSSSSSSNSSSDRYSSNAGGIAGAEGIISNCYNTGSVSSSSYRNSYAGGIVGYGRTISSCYNTGSVSSSSGKSYAGGIAGYDRTISNCYYLNTINIEGTTINSRGMAKTAEEMKDEKFIYDLGSLSWKLDEEDVNEGYPILETYNIEELEDIIEINYIEDLQELRFQVNSGKDYSGKTIKLMRTLDFKEGNSYRNGIVNGFLISGSGFMPIGNESSKAFKGTFKGQGYEIRNLYINRNMQYAGLFGYISGAEIKDLGLSGIIISSSNNNNSYAGGIAGYASGSTISNSYNTGSVSSSSSSYAGGIAGYASGSTISNSYNTGEVSSNGSYSTYAGGIAGYASGSTISNSYNTGEVSSNGSYSTYAGGIAGRLYSNSTISNSYNTGEVSSNSSSSSSYSAYAGGIAGDGSTISNSYNTGSVSSSCSSSNDAYAGGIAGYGRTISNSYNTGEVSSSCSSSNDAYAGGIAGYGITISNSYNTGEVSSSSNGLGYAGGIAGYVTSSSTISNSYNTGEVSSRYAGGIAGYASGSTIINSYNTGEVSGSNSAGGIAGYVTNSSIISNSYNTGSVSSSGTYVGGIAGGVYLNSTIINSYNTGEVSSSNSSYSYAGGIAGDVYYGTISNCYYLNTIILQGTKLNTSGQSSSEVYLKSKEFYETLNVDKVWLYRINNYPILLNSSILSNIEPATEITINNTIKKYKITTDINEIDNVKGGSISGEDELPYEMVEYNKNNSKEINIIPDLGYVISNIRINDEDITYIVDDYGNYKIPENYFEKVQEDKHIVVTFSEVDKTIKIKKVDKDGAELEGATFEAQSINLQETKTYTATTNSEGIATLGVEDFGDYIIKEIEAPEHYVLSNEEKTVNITEGNSEQEVEFENTRKTEVVVHHYLKGTTSKVADDDILEGAIGEKYEVQPHIDLDKLKLVQDETLNFESGTKVFESEGKEYIFYYEPEKIKLTIHHYYEGTENKVVEDEIIETSANVVFGEEPQYSVTTDARYELKTNTNYNNLIEENDFIGVNSTIDTDITIEDTLEYSKDEEITYYYKIREYEYTVNYFYNGIKDENATETDVALYNNTIESYIEKDKFAYRFFEAKALDENGEETELPLKIKEDISKNVINVYYVPDETVTKDLMYIVEYYKSGELQEDDTLTKNITVQILQPNTLTVDKEEIMDEDKYYGYKIDLESTGEIASEVETGTIIKIYYIPDETVTKDLSYTVEYYKDGDLQEPDTLIKKKTVQVLQPDTLTVNKEEINTIDKYENCILDQTIPTEIPDIVNNGDIIKIYYISSTNYKFEKKWNISNEDNLNKYRSTFTLYKTINNEEPQIVKDEYKIITAVVTEKNGTSNEITYGNIEQPIEISVVGNGSVVFNNLIKYENGEEIHYFVEESKIEKTNNNGTTWNDENKDKYLVEKKEADGIDDLIENTPIYNITTEILENQSGQRNGGTVTGEYTDEYLETNNIKYVETVKETKDATRDIIITPDAGFKIVNITINETNYNFIPDNNGTVIISKEYFTNVIEDYHIKVTFGDESKIFKIEKEDDEGNKLEGATFEITNKMDLSSKISEIKRYDLNSNYGEYYFQETENGKYVSNNRNIDNTQAVSYSTIDLSELNGKYIFKVNAEVSSEENYDYGYILLEDLSTPIEAVAGTGTSTSTSTSTATATSTGTSTSSGTSSGLDFSRVREIVKISGEVNSKDYEVELEGGKNYRVYYVYGKDSSSANGNDMFIINSVILSGIKQRVTTNSNGEAYVEVSADGTYEVKEITAPEGFEIKEESKEIKVPDEISEALVFENKAKTFDITTEIAENDAGNRAGGTVTGIFNEEHLEQNNIRYVESVKAKHNAVNDIELIPSTGYHVESIKINKSNYSFTPDNTGKVIIPKEEFTNITVNQHVIVKFAANTKTITIKKEDESGNGLTGAKFEISGKDIDRSNYLGEIRKYNLDNSYSSYEMTGQTDGTYSSNNENKNGTVALSRMELDLSDLEGSYRFNVNAQISSEENHDYGYVVIMSGNSNPIVATGTSTATSTGTLKAATSTSTSTSTITATAASSESEENSSIEFMYLLKISGEMVSKDYWTNLKGGNKYYIYFGYQKDDANSVGEDKFTINSVSLSKSGYDVTKVTDETDENGITTVDITGYGDYVIKEIQAPDHYLNNNEEHDIIIEPEIDEYNDTFVNEHKPYLIVHHYYKDSEGRYTTNKVAEDEITEKNPEENYETSAKSTLTGLTRAKENNVVVEPENRNGTIHKENVEVNYYYEVIPVTLTIHHYIDGTTESLKEDETVNTVPTVTFPSDDTYSITSEFEYDLGENNNYKELIANKTFVKVVNNTSENSVLNIDENLDYTTNTEITYFYKETETYNYTIHYREQGVDGEEGKLAEDKFVEDVEDEEPITETAIDINGYTIVNPSSVEISAENNEYTFYYTRRNDLTYTVHYREQGVEGEAGKLAEDKVVNSQTFGDTVTENAIDIAGFEKVNPTSAEVEITTGINEVTFYYTRRNDLSYTVHYREQGVEGEAGKLADDKVVNSQTFGKVITSSNEAINIENYTFREADKETLTLGLDNSLNVITLYYSLRNDLSYTVNYYEKGTTNAIKTAKVVENQLFGTEILSSNEVIEIPGYIYDSVSTNSITISSNETENVINVYYVLALKVTTEVTEHTEHYSNGTTKTVKGGTITGEDNESGYLELVGKGRDATTPIVITPNSGYKISKITVNGNELDVDSYIAENGTVTLNAENCNHLKTITSDVKVIAEFAKETKVIVKYLEKGTNDEVATDEVITGIEGTTFETARKELEDYRETEVALTRNGEPTGETASKTYKGFYVDGDLTAYIEGNNVMYSNTLTIIYWYEKIPQATLTVKYIEVDKEDISNGLTLSSGREIDSESYTLKVGETVETRRRTITDTTTGRTYIAVDGPVVLRSTIGNVEGTKVVILHKDENSYTETIEEVDTNNDGNVDSVEVRYYYKRQYKITAKVEGGTFESTESTETTEITEIVDRKGNNTKKMVAKPANEDYVIKNVKINGKEVNLETLIDSVTGLVTIKEAYFEGGVTEDKNIVITFQKIPTDVIVRYIDIDTKEEIIGEDIEVGGIGESYTTQRKELTGYEKAGEEPANSTGTRTKEDIIVTYYYKKVEIVPSEETKTEENTTNDSIDNALEEEIHTPRMANIARQRRTGNVKTGDKIFAFVSLFILAIVGFGVAETHRIQRYGKHRK